MTGWVYAIHDEHDKIVYVGQTIETPAARYRGHLRDAIRGSETPFHVWLRARIEAGEVPRVSTIERPSDDALTDRETYWIRHYAAERSDQLLNVSARPQVPSPKRTRSAEIRAIKNQTRRAAYRLSDGPIALTAVAEVAGLCCSEMNDIDLEAVHHQLCQSGYVRRGGAYVRLGTDADYFSDPDIDLRCRLRNWLELHEKNGSVKLSSASEKLCAPVDEVRRNLSWFGYVHASDGIWSKIRLIQQSSTAAEGVA
jgi:hypothetical protein